MQIRKVLVLTGIVAAVGLAAFAGVATADSTPDPTVQAEKLLASYGKTNQKLAACMKEKGLPFNGGLAKSDVVDAFGTIDQGHSPPRSASASRPVRRRRPTIPTRHCSRGCRSSSRACGVTP
ncbi:hypothetical protein [Micromonospora zhanjiangensis]